MDGGGGNDQPDLRKMSGLIWDQTAHEFHWGDRTLSYENIARFRYNEDTVIHNSIGGTAAIWESDSDDGSVVASIGATPMSFDLLWA